ncbi:uncharacterized protein LOC116546095 [Sapajus apella]|uniref:Uncharacterized protein LOC116546095 n=1 Tax=Sapajus apella TaxID=9515 RepID=A0A6J3HDR2_SAPAP|nr:uncharacterized protein LOC116546095 [Sapajus apella]
MKEADKLTLGQTVHIKVPHSVSTLMSSPRHQWLSNAYLTHYQGLLYENPWVTIETVHGLHLATFLPTKEGAPDLDCEEVVDEIFTSWPGLKDCPLPKADLNLFTDGSSYVQNGESYAGYAVTTAIEVVEAAPLPRGWSAQSAELHALIQALCHMESKVASIYTNSKCTFATVHILGVIYKERGLLTAGGKEMKNKEESLRLLEGVWKPKEVAVMHCKGHHRGTDLISTGNQLADPEAKAAALQKEPVQAPTHLFSHPLAPRGCGKARML